MDFSQLLGVLQNPPEGVLPDGIYDDLQAAYDSKPDFSDELATVKEAKEALEAKLGEANDKVSSLVNQNYDLLQRVGVGQDPSPTAESEAPSEPQNPVDALKALFTPNE